MNQIAVILNNQNELASVWDEKIHIQVFSPALNRWEAERNILMGGYGSKPPAVMRNEIVRLTEELKDVKIILGKTISGLFYQIFDRKGFLIIEADHFSVALLDQIIQEVEAQKNTDAASAQTHTYFQLESPGYYRLDLISLQKEMPEVSSKMVLQPFLKSTPFLRLTIRCRHVPNWLQSDAEKGGWNILHHSDGKNAKTVIVEPACCE